MSETAVEEVTSGELAIQPGQSTWTPQQLAVLRQIGIEDASDADVDLFFHVCRTSGLDPFRREIYMIGRKTKVNVREVNPDTGNAFTVERYVNKFTIQTGINGFRKRARELAEAKGIKLGFDGPLWCGDDGVWRDVWPEGKPPVAAKFTVFRDGEPISFVAHYSEYVQMSGSGQSAGPNSMWAKMPRNQTGKCAEAGAIQRAFPDELGGLLFEDAAQQTIIDESGDVVQAVQKRPSAGKGVAGMRAEREKRAQQRAIVAEAAAHPDETPEQSELRKSVRQKLNDGIFAEFGKLKLTGEDKRNDRLVVMRALLERPELQSSKELDDDALQKLRNKLTDRRKAGTIEDFVRDTLNAETLRSEGVE